MPATNQSAVSTLIREVLADPDLAHDEVFRRLLQAGLQDLVDAEAAAVIGAQRYERTPERTNRRNGKRLKTVATTAGEVELAIPELRTGSFFPSLLHPRRRVDKAQMRRDLLRVDRGGLHPQGLATSCGPWATSRASRARRSRGSATGIDEGVHEFLSRRLDRTWFPYVFVDATYLDVRVGHRVVCRALVVATGVSAEGRREILGMALGDAETTDFWTSFLRSLRERGLKVPSPHDPEGVVLVTSDAHAGIRAAVRAILPGASWQRCRVHFARSITSRLGSARPRARGRPGLHDLRPDQQGGGGGPVQARHRRLEGPVPRDRPDADRRRAGPDRVRRLPPRALDQDLVQQSHRAAQPGDQAPSRRRPGLPRQRVRTPPDRIRPVRATEEWQYGERRYLSQTSLRRLTDMLQADNSTDGVNSRPALPPITT